MRIPGKRIKRTRLIQTEKYAVAVDLVIPIDDPNEPCYESETVQLLRDIKDRAERGDVAWLTKIERVYTAMEPVDNARSSPNQRMRWTRVTGRFRMKNQLTRPTEPSC